MCVESWARGHHRSVDAAPSLVHVCTIQPTVWVLINKTERKTGDDLQEQGG